MTQKSINLGTADQGNGDPIRVAFGKVNDNFTELYTALGLNVGGLNLGAFEFTGSVMSTTDSTPIVIDQAVTVSSNLTVGGDVLPSVANGGDLGSAARPWRSLYVSNSTIYLGGTALSVDGSGNLTTGGTVVGSTPAWANITGKPTIPTSFDRLVNGAHELELVVNGETPYVTFPAVGGGNIIIQGSEIGADGSGAASIATLTSGESDVKLSANATATNGPRRNWTFGTDGALTLPGDIRSEGNINIEINLADSTLRRWSFGEDGALTFPDGTSQSTAGGAGGGSTLVNGANTLGLGSTGILTFPNGAFKIAGNKIRNVNESVGLILGSEIEVTVAKTVISNGLTDTEGPSNQHIFEVGSTRIFSAYQVINTLGDGEGGPSLTGQQLTELTSTGFQIGYRVINDLGEGEGEPLTSFSGWTFGTVGQSQAITFPDGTIQTTAPESFSFSVAADDSTQRAVSNNELVKFIGAGGVTTASDAEGNITINYVQGDITGNNDINITVDSGDSSSHTWNFDQTGDLTAPGDITTGLDGLGGRFIQDCADGDTSMRWINVNQGSSSTQLIRAYTGDPKLNTEVERAQIKLNWDQTEDKSGLTIRTFDQSNPNNEVDHDWLFKGDGVLQLPVGGDIVDSEGNSVLSGGTSIQSTTWVQDFETSLGAPADVPLMATSVEYLANGDIVALFTHDVNSNSSTYSGVARFDSYGTKVWSMKFEGNDGDIYTNGWGLAVDNVNGFIYVAGAKAAETGYQVATLTKLSEIDGDVVWSKSYDVGYNNSNMVVDVASDGNPVVVGYADNGTDNQVVTTKINADTGSVTWSRALNGLGDEEAYGMAVGPSGEVVSVGDMDNIIDYVGPVRTVLTLTATPASDPDWTTDILGVTVGGLTYDITFAGGVATFSNIVDVTGNRSVSDFAGNITGDQIGSGTTNMTVTVATTTMEDIANRILVVKYLSDGTIDWQAAVQVEAGYDCKGADADIDGSGSIYVCGNFDYSDGTGGTYQAIILFKFDSAGVKQWSRKVQGDCEDFAASIVVGPDNYLYLSAVTGTTNTSDYTMVIAKYNTNGTVVWQRLLDHTTTWTFAGGLFFNNSGGSNLAVRDGYVAVSGSFGDPGTTPHAVVAQFDTLGTTFSMGDYDFIAATFSGVLDSAASNITVDGTSKLDSDYIEEFTTSNFSPTVDLTSDLIGTIYSSTSGTVGTVKLTAPGSRKIEEVYGYNSVSVTSRNFGSVVTSTAQLANTGAEYSIPISVSALELADLVALVNGTTGYYFEVSLDQSSWRKASYGGYNSTLGSEYFIFYLTNSSLPVSQGQTAYYRIVTGADPVVWWDAATLPNGDNNFRGATIDYHAWTGESTIIGTIHIVNDSGEEHISHSEVQSGSTDGENDDLWVVLNEGTVSYQRIDGESKTLKIQWTAKVFYGSEYYD